MIYLFTGSDVHGVRSKALQWVAAAKQKAPDATYIRINADEVSESVVRGALGAQGLFYSKALVVLDDPFSKSEAAETVLSMLDELKESGNAIVLIAPKLLAARVKKVEAKAEKTYTVDLKVKKEARGFNSALVNALAARDSAALWREVVLAMRNGEVPEQIHGLLHWKARDMMQKGGRGWSPDEARGLSRELIELVADARGGGLPLKESLERFALSLKR